MLEVMPGTLLDHVRSLLAEARRAITAPLNAMTPQDAFNGYLEWASTQVRALRGVISAAELDRLITTRLYWSMFARSPVDFGPALRSTVDGELHARQAALDVALRVFDADVATWGGGRALAVVPDTSVFIEHGAGFPDLGWHEMLQERSNVPIRLVVTMAAVRELDAKKLSRDQAAAGQQVRSQVRAALRRIEELFPRNDQQSRFDTGLSRVTTTLLTDDLGHDPLSDADGEMIRRGLDVRPYAGRGMLVTYDLAQTFRARAAGLDAHRLRYGYEDATPAR